MFFNPLIPSGFPFWNLTSVDTEPDARTLSLAVAGYPKENLTVTTGNSTLNVKGVPKIHSEDVRYVHRGITQKAFNVSYSIDGYVVDSTSYQDGILSIVLKKSSDGVKIHSID